MKNSPSDGGNGYLKYQTCLHWDSRAVYDFQTPQMFSYTSFRMHQSTRMVSQYVDCPPPPPPTSRLAASKNRLAPLKVTSISRLELMGAVLSTRLAKGITDVMAVNKTVFWTDSTNVCSWVPNPSRNFKQNLSQTESAKYTRPQTPNNGDMFQEKSTLLT